MFDLTKMRPSVLDQLHCWQIYETTRPLRTVDGVECPAGMEFRFEHAIVNVLAREAEIHGLGPDDRELVFFSRADEHRGWFVNTGREYRPGPPPAPPADPESEGPNWQAWLARQEGFEDAVKILNGISTGRRNWGSSRAEGDVLRFAALRLERTHRVAAGRLADHALNCYYAWMSQATSGGEGTAMQAEIRDQVEQMRKLAGA